MKVLQHKFWFQNS